MTSLHPSNHPAVEVHRISCWLIGFRHTGVDWQLTFRFVLARTSDLSPKGLYALIRSRNA